MGHFIRVSAALYFLFLSIQAVAHVEPATKGAIPRGLDQWIEWSQPIAIKKMLTNISPAGTAQGVVVASPSKYSPDYFYHWIRDAGLTMDVVVSLYAHAEGDAKNFYRNRLLDFVAISIRNQKTPNKSGGVGEPKFLATGEAFDGEWGRPQDDSPALRALAFIRWARILMLEGNYDLVTHKLYTGGWDSVIKTDLEYVSHSWKNTCFDLWEETRGHHFFTRMVQRKALLEGADLASQLGDAGAAIWYRQQGNELANEILKHWNGSLLLTTLDRDGGIEYKYSGIDSSVVLGLIHGQRNDGFLRLSDERVVATIHLIESSFNHLYPINKLGHRGIAIGRYPEDQYTGYSAEGNGNPWFINTNALAQYYYALAQELKHTAEIRITQTSQPFWQSLFRRRALKTKLQMNDLRLLSNWAQQRGDDYLSCSQFHMGEDGSMTEQFNRRTGFMQGAPDLTWSYASLLTAQWARF